MGNTNDNDYGNEREDFARGLLLGVAIGDAYGLPYEGLSRKRASKWVKGDKRFHLFGRRGVVSDDTEQSVLLLEAVLSSKGNIDAAMKRFRWSMVGWFWRLPWGIGLSTLKACLLMTVGVRRSGRNSAGNGAAMRAGALALFSFHREKARVEMCDAIARTTHVDERAVQGARFVCELSALCLRAPSTSCRSDLVNAALRTVDNEELRTTVLDAVKSAAVASSTAGDSTGFVIHTLHTAVYFFCRDSTSPFEALVACVRHGGDTDSIGAILGGWLGALYGANAFPAELVQWLPRGPFGRLYLQALARASIAGAPIPRWSWPLAMARNLLLYPVILAHGFRRLLPW